MHWERLKLPANAHTWLLVVLALACLSLAAFIIGGLGIGLAATGVLLFFFAYLARSDEGAVKQ